MREVHSIIPAVKFTKENEEKWREKINEVDAEKERNLIFFMKFERVRRVVSKKK